MIGPCPPPPPHYKVEAVRRRSSDVDFCSATGFGLNFVVGGRGGAWPNDEVNFLGGGGPNKYNSQKAATTTAATTCSWLWSRRGLHRRTPTQTRAHTHTHTHTHTDTHTRQHTHRHRHRHTHTHTHTHTFPGQSPGHAADEAQPTPWQVQCPCCACRVPEQLVGRLPPHLSSADGASTESLKGVVGSGSHEAFQVRAPRGTVCSKEFLQQERVLCLYLASPGGGPRGWGR